MTKLLDSDKLTLQLHTEIINLSEDFIKARDVYRKHVGNEPTFFGQHEHEAALLDDLIKLSEIEQKLDTLSHVINLIESGVYDNND
jgi:hypothetical protein